MIFNVFYSRSEGVADAEEELAGFRGAVGGGVVHTVEEAEVVAELEAELSEGNLTSDGGTEVETGQHLVVVGVAGESDGGLWTDEETESDFVQLEDVIHKHGYTDVHEVFRESEIGSLSHAETAANVVVLGEAHIRAVFGVGTGDASHIGLDGITLITDVNAHLSIGFSCQQHYGSHGHD